MSAGGQHVDSLAHSSLVIDNPLANRFVRIVQPLPMIFAACHGIIVLRRCSLWSAGSKRDFWRLESNTFCKIGLTIPSSPPVCSFV
jgi:hypothetical protein